MLPDVEELYEVCRIGHLLRRKTDQLSGGERQRIALARLLSTSPRLLLLDEPYSNLDPGHKNILRSVVRDVSEKLKITCILVSHDPLDVLSWAQEILVLEGGRMIQKGGPEQVYRRPVSEYEAGLFGSYTMITPQQAVALRVKPGIFRPEYLKIARVGEHKRKAQERGGGEVQDAARGEVSRVDFAGRSYEVEVLLEGSPVTISTSSGQFVKGEPVYISIDYDNYPP
jgi:ABC-type sulfate/molybdate transport systems ATPase subunit